MRARWSVCCSHCVCAHSRSTCGTDTSDSGRFQTRLGGSHDPDQSQPRRINPGRVSGPGLSGSVCLLQQHRLGDVMWPRDLSLFSVWDCGLRGTLPF